MITFHFVTVLLYLHRLDFVLAAKESRFATATAGFAAASRFRGTAASPSRLIYQCNNEHHSHAILEEFHGMVLLSQDVDLKGKGSNIPFGLEVNHEAGTDNVVLTTIQYSTHITTIDRSVDVVHLQPRVRVPEPVQSECQTFSNAAEYILIVDG